MKVLLSSRIILELGGVGQSDNIISEEDLNFTIKNLGGYPKHNLLADYFFQMFEDIRLYDVEYFDLVPT